MKTATQTATFYTHVADINSFVCRLLRTVYDKQTGIAVRCNSEEQCQTLNQQLWTFNHNTFLAHNIWQDNLSTISPIVLIPPQANAAHCPINTVLNLSLQPCLETNIIRVLEIIGNDETSLSQARQRFRIYKDAKFTLEHYSMLNKA